MIPAGHALVTGASSGLGESFARALAARKINLVLVARSKEKLETLASDLRASFTVMAEPLAFDLSVPDSATRLAEELHYRGIPVDLLVNNAGFAARGEFWNLDMARQSEMIALNVQAVVELTYHLLPHMTEQRRGGIINVSSITSFQPIPYVSAYSATKAFVTSFSLGLAEELRPLGISVVTLCPGGMRTNFRIEGSPAGKQKFPGGPQAPDEVVEVALKALERGGGLVVPRLINKAVVFSQRFVSRALVPKVLGRLSRPK